MHFSADWKITDLKLMDLPFIAALRCLCTKNKKKQKEQKANTV